MLDSTDWQILRLLQTDSRLQWQEIGKLVHLTGQAVSARIRRMQEAGIIQAFTVTLDHTKLGRPLLAFITVFMTSSNHADFQRFIKNQPGIEEIHRVSGEGCYWLKARMENQQQLSTLLDGILAHGNYKVTLSIDRIV